ncbi:GNAT family N-acetyltransferase [Veronia pacifica]|uniref:N-acetyltransferase domain-containing protein n=1 Tax=Veronia pacifica TaxID=1080227 RepID=A0A1C3E7K7_9GAMM|nr:GNAT family N-acetyltransferase [Veronia pacifica]ODA29216.1 hypothetical protein A8L45_22555 [Veronia pacifica]
MLVTERLVLTRITKEDMPLFDEILSCPEQTRYLPNEAPYSAAERDAYVTGRLEHWQQHGFGTYVIRLRDDLMQRLGYVGIEHSPNPSFLDIRFGVLPAKQGQGFVTEGAGTLLNHFLGVHKGQEVFGVAMVPNTASISVLKKLGMTPADANLYDCEGLATFSISAPHC